MSGLTFNKLSQFWDAAVTPASGAEFAVSNHLWFGGKKAGEFLELGFQLSYVGAVEPKIISASLSGIYVCTGEGKIIRMLISL